MTTTHAVAPAPWPWWTKAGEHLRVLQRTSQWLAECIGADAQVLEGWLRRPPDATCATAPRGEAHLVMRIAAFFGWPAWYLYDARHSYPLPPSLSAGLTMLPSRLRQPPQFPPGGVHRTSLSASSMREWDR